MESVRDTPYTYASAHLPPVSAAPILEYYDYERRTLDPDHLLTPPVDERGVVDVFKTLDLVMSQVDPDYVWPKSHCDVHHFVWERSNYLPANHDGDQIPNQYREIPFHKGYLPRQLHNFIHATVAPPAIPEYAVMENRVRSYLVAKRLFETARIATRFERRPSSLSTVKKDANGEVAVEEAILKEILIRLHDQYAVQLGAIDMETSEFISSETIQDHPIDLAATRLGRIAAIQSLNLLPRIYSNRAA